ncbi:MAG: AAA family ATPase [Candidatus Dependentiae bacterium]|nr:AAA family ATPase [Candidatus Dependentiae bacterium]
MKFLKKQILWMIMFGLVISPMQSLKADIFDKTFAKDVATLVSSYTLSTAIVLSVAYCLKIAQNKKLLDKSEMDANSSENYNYLTVYFPGDIKTTFKDVAGLSGAKAEMEDIVSFLKNPKVYNKIGAKTIKGVLLSGNPGNGKTLLAAAVAGEANCPFISMSGASFAEMYVGVGAMRVRQLFKIAHKLAEEYGACIIFIDEIDAVAQKRGSGGTSGDHDHNQTIAKLLESMDGLEKDKNPIIVLAATNRVGVLDPAVVRPGRFDRKVVVSEPEIKDRIALLTRALKKVEHSSKIDITRIARITEGFSGAKLAQLINDAAILAIHADRQYVDVLDIEQAYDHITLGREIKGMERNNADKWITAIHEAGHAAGYLFGNNKKYAIHKASIVPRSHSLGVVWTILTHESHSLTEEDMKASIVMTLCGGIAEQVYGFSKSTGVSSDLAAARRIAYDMVVRYGMSPQLNYLSYDEIDHMLPNDIATEIHKEVQKIIEGCFVVAQQLVESHKSEIKKIAELLMKKGTVLGDEIYNVVNLPLPNIECDLVI